MLTKIVVGKVVEVILPKCATFKGNFGCVIAGFIETLYCLKEKLVLLLVRRQFNHQCLLHSPIVDYIVPYVKYFKKGGKGNSSVF